MLQPGIIDLPIVNSTQQNGSGGRAPRLCVIGDNPLTGSIIVLNFQLCQQGQIFSINISLPPTKTNPTAEPSIAQDRADCIAPLGQHLGYIVGLITQTL